jgi:HD superfamily phosphohydrolase
MTNVTFADVVFPNLTFDKDDPTHRLVLELIDNPWIQRLRDISQTANTRLVYMFSEHSRFGHSIGVAYLADQILVHLQNTCPDADIKKYKTAIVVAALLHDIGHLAPGSHTAFKTWFPGKKDSHEDIAVRIITEDATVKELLAGHDPKLPALIAEILSESGKLPRWTWQIISGGGWNVDRGNWCIADSILAGVSYGKYNIHALSNSLTITRDGDLALQENRLDAMMHFVVSRHAMYRQVYYHRVLLSADTINTALIRRARDIQASLPFCDPWMKQVLSAETPAELSLETIFHMREAWWRYHLLRWVDSGDAVLSDLANRLINRKLFKTVRVTDEKQHKELKEKALEVLKDSNLDQRYYLHEVTTADVQAGDSSQSILVTMDSGESLNLAAADPLFTALSKISQKRWICLPEEIKNKLGKPK